MQVNDVLYSDLTILGNYTEFLEPFVAISSSSEQAIVAVDVEDTRWLNLDPVKRDIARSTEDSISWLQHMTSSYKGDNLRELPLHNTRDMARWLLFTETIFDNTNGLRILEAELYVAHELGQIVTNPQKWPDSFYFVDFAYDSGNVDLTLTLENVREELTLNDVVVSIDRIERLCTVNQIETCSPNVLDVLLADEPNKLTGTEQEKISISFIALEIEKELLLVLAPPIILALFFRLVGNENRWRRFVGRVKRECSTDNAMEEDLLWSITDGLRPQVGRMSNPSEIVQGYVMFFFLTLAILLPSIAQGSILWYGISADWNEAWIGIVSVTCACSVIGLVRLIWIRWVE